MKTTGGPRGNRAATGGIILGSLLFACGCAGPRLAPVDLQESGWVVRESQVVWRPRRDAPELVGELMVATHPDGRRFVQLSKQALPLVTAQQASQGWNLSSTLRRGRFGGGLPATDRVPWFQFSTLPPSRPISPRWRLETGTNGAWRLSQPDTGEVVEGGVP